MEEIERPSASLETLNQAVVTLAVESWRFSKVFERILTKLDAGEQQRYVSQFRWYMKKVDEALDLADLRIVNVEGFRFDPGIAATPLNVSDFQEDDMLYVEQMLEPILMNSHGLVRTGTVTLKKVD